MRILFINQYFPPDATNSAHLLGDLTEDLSSTHEVTVIAGRPSYGATGEVRDPPGVRVLRSWSSRFNRASMGGRLANYATFLLSSLFTALSLHRTDLVVTLTDPPIIGLIGWLASKRHRCPLVMVYQDIFPDIAVALGKMQNPLTIAAWARLNQRLRRDAAAIVVVGRDMKEKLHGEGVQPTKVVYLPNWGSAQSNDVSKIASARRRHGWDDHFVVMHAGNVGLAQNLLNVIRAAELLTDDDEVLFVFLGDGASKQLLTRESERRNLGSIVFLPHQPKSDAQLLMAAADVHLISLAPGLRGCAAPSKTYGIFAAGRPAIGALEKGSEIALTLDEFDCGVVVEPDSPECLAQAIRDMKSSPLEEMGRRGLLALEKKFERRMITSRYKELFEDVAGQ